MSRRQQHDARHSLLLMRVGAVAVAAELNCPAANLWCAATSALSCRVFDVQKHYWGATIIARGFRALYMVRAGRGCTSLHGQVPGSVSTRT